MEALQGVIGRLAAALSGFRNANRQLFNLIAAAVLLTGIICVVVYMLDPGAPVVLAGNLAAPDRTALALRLRHHQIDFTLGADSISVAPRDLEAARRVLDSAPGFPGGGADFSLFDHSTMGQSDFDEQVDYQRSLQGELERTIMDIRGIDSARVMLAMGRPSPFALGPSEAARASVMLMTAPGALIDASTAAAIAHLVAGSVRGLAVESVTVSGNDGTIIYPPQHPGELGEAIHLRNDFEHRLQEKVAALLTRIMGENRYAVEVAVDVDTSRVTRKDQLYGNGDQAILSEEHSVTPVAAQPGGIPGLTSNLPTPVATPAPEADAAAGKTAADADRKTGSAPVREAATASPATRKDIVNYQPSTRQIDTITAPVRIKRISVAAVLDGTYDGGHFKPLPAERLEAIKGLIAAAVGADLARGDSVDVQSAALSQPYVPPVPNPVTELRTLMSDPVHLYAAAGAALLLLILMLWMGKRAVSRRLRPRPALTQTPSRALPERAAQLPAPAAAEVAEAAEPANARPRNEFDQLRAKINEEAGRNPKAAAAILSRWLAEAPRPANESRPA